VPSTARLARGPVRGFEESGRRRSAAGLDGNESEREQRPLAPGPDRSAGALVPGRFNFVQRIGAQMALAKGVEGKEWATAGGPASLASIWRRR
jgi:hypothetical protein